MVDKLSKLTNGVVFCLEKRITKPPMSQTQAELWDVLEALAPPDCPSMQADVKSFYKKLKYNRDMKLKKYIKNIKDWYTKCSLSKLQNDLHLKIVECNDLHSRLDLQKESFEKQMKGALEKISDLEKPLHDFEQKHGNLREVLPLT